MNCSKANCATGARICFFSFFVLFVCYKLCIISLMYVPFETSVNAIAFPTNPPLYQHGNDLMPKWLTAQRSHTISQCFDSQMSSRKDPISFSTWFHDYCPTKKIVFLFQRLVSFGYCIFNKYISKNLLSFNLSLTQDIVCVSCCTTQFVCLSRF